MKFCKFTKLGSEDVIFVNPSIVSSVKPRKGKAEGSEIVFEDAALIVPEDAEEVVRMLDKALAG